MRHEVRTIPPAPRLVRMRPLCAHRWPLLAVGAVRGQRLRSTLTIVGIAVGILAVVLLTADDLGKLDRDDFELRPRVTAHAG